VNRPDSLNPSKPKYGQFKLSHSRRNCPAQALSLTFDSFFDILIWMKNLVLVFFFFTLTPLVLGISLFSLATLNRFKLDPQTPIIVTYSNHSGIKIFASLPSEIPTITGVANFSDARSEILKQYLTRYNSPLEPYANYLVTTADKYKIDFRLLTAIAQQESNLCKVIPADSYNCWGWGVHSKGSLGFASFEEGIETVTKGLKEEYIDKGYVTPEQIMSKYTPLSNGSWAYGVNKFLSQME